jgi:hypothetical protein
MGLKRVEAARDGCQHGRAKEGGPGKEDVKVGGRRIGREKLV